MYLTYYSTVVAAANDSCRSAVSQCRAEAVQCQEMNDVAAAVVAVAVVT